MVLNLSKNAVSVWVVRVSAHQYDVARFLAALLPGEVQQAERFVRAIDRARFIIARGSLRMLVGAALVLDPRQVVFSSGVHGKPYVAGAELHFNLSHAGDLIVCALSRERVVGVDVEYADRRLDAIGLAQRYFSETEYRQLLDFNIENRDAAFLRMWVVKEAYIKMTGRGLMDLSQAAPVDANATVQQIGSSASVAMLEVGPKHLAALATPEACAHQVNTFI